MDVIIAVTQAYEPHSNPVERMHRTIEASIRGLMHQENAHPGQWFRYVPGALAAFRQTPLANLPTSPHYMVYGQHPVVPAQLALGPKSKEPPTMALDQVFEGLKNALEKVHVRQLQNHEENKKQYDKKVKRTLLKLGDWVYKYAPLDPTATGQSCKTAGCQDGPYRVLNLPNDRMVTLAKNVTEKGGIIKRASETVSRDRVHKVSPWDLSKIPAPLAWPTAKRYKPPVGWQPPKTNKPATRQPQHWMPAMPAITPLSRVMEAHPAVTEDATQTPPQREDLGDTREDRVRPASGDDDDSESLEDLMSHESSSPSELIAHEPTSPEMEADNEKEHDGGQKRPRESPTMSQGSDKEEDLRSPSPKRPSFLHTLAK